jgi:hypothetical protein
LRGRTNRRDHGGIAERLMWQRMQKSHEPPDVAVFLFRSHLMLISIGE